MAVGLTGYLQTQTPAVSSLDTSTSGGALAAGQQNLNSSYQTFLTLLTTQLKNQDPNSPLDTNAFTQQLVQMTGVQQQLLSNQLLQQLVNQGGGSVQDAVGLIGKTVTATSNTASLKGGSAQWTYTLPQAASQATLSIKNASGRVVWTGPAPSLASGEHAFSWDGKDSTGVAQPSGPYTLSVSASDVNGANVAAATAVTGLATAVRQVDGATVVTIGGADAPLSSITAVSG
jgi:flagellar basal-body rod modification protein FlgD